MLHTVHAFLIPNEVSRAVLKLAFDHEPVSISGTSIVFLYPSPSSAHIQISNVHKSHSEIPAVLLVFDMRILSVFKKSLILDCWLFFLGPISTASEIAFENGFISQCQTLQRDYTQYKKDYWEGEMV